MTPRKINTHMSTPTQNTSTTPNETDARNLLAQTRAKVKSNVNQKKELLAKIKKSISIFLSIQKLSSPELENDLKRVLSFKATAKDFKCVHKWSDQMQCLIHLYGTSLRDWIDFLDNFEASDNEEEMRTVLFDMAKAVQRELANESKYLDRLDSISELTQNEELEEKMKFLWISEESFQQTFPDKTLSASSIASSKDETSETMVAIHLAKMMSDESIQQEFENAVLSDDDDQWSVSEDGSYLQMQIRGGILLTKPKLDKPMTSLASDLGRNVSVEEAMLAKKIDICICTGSARKTCSHDNRD